MISDIYQAALRRRAIQNFIKTNARAPNEAEAREATASILEQYPTVDTVGFSGIDIERPQWQEESSVDVEGTNRQALFDDAVVVNTRLNELEVLLEDSFRGFYATVARLDAILRNQEARVDKLLLLNSNVDVFAYGVEETFDLADKIDWTQTTASVESGYVLLGRNGLTVLDLDRARIGVSAVSDSTIVSYGASTGSDALKQDDGNLYEFMVYTTDQLGRTTCIIDIDLDGPNYVQQLEVTGLVIEANKHAYATLAYSLDGSAYTLLEPVERALRPETVFDIGLAGVRKLQLRVAKGAADIKTGDNFVTIFSFDSLKVYTDDYSTALESQIVCGPYSIQDCEGRDIYYTKATLSCCTVEPEKTAISWFLSADGSDPDTALWIPIDPSRLALTTFNAGDSSASQAVDYVDPAADARVLKDQISILRNLRFKDEAVLNSYINAAYVDKIPTRTMVVKRNVVDGVTASSYQTPPGWLFDNVSQRYSTTLYVADSEGRWIDFGPNGVYVEGQQLTGKVYFTSGYTKVSTDDSNWELIDETIVDVESLKLADPLYPYNHKYLIEGYPYTNGFRGARVYNGVTEYFGLLLKYLPLEEFGRLQTDDSRYYSSFTLETALGGDLYLKVKVKKTDSSWTSEYISADWTVQGGPTNQIWAKAILSTESTARTPIIEDFNIRVI